MVDMTKREMGPFETQYKKIFPHGQQGDQAILKRYPEHREFIFEQFLKTERNSPTVSAHVNQLEEQLVGGLSGSSFFWIMGALMIIAAIFLFKG